MTSHIDPARCRTVWQAAIITWLKDIRARIANARPHGGSTLNFNGARLVLKPTAIEIRDAEIFLRSPRFAEACELAGVRCEPDAALAWCCDNTGSADRNPTYGRAA